MPKRDGPGEQFVRRNFGRVWPVHLGAFLRLLRGLRVSFDGDLDLLLIMTCIAERTPGETWVHEAHTLRKLLTRSADAPGQQPINIQSISDYTGIPRETVRRKVETLQRKGWIRRGPDGYIAVTEQAATDLEAATGYTVAYLAEIFAAHDEVAGRLGGESQPDAGDTTR